MTCPYILENSLAKVSSAISSIYLGTYDNTIGKSLKAFNLEISSSNFSLVTLLLWKPHFLFSKSFTSNCIVNINSFRVAVSDNVEDRISKNKNIFSYGSRIFF